MGDETVLAVQKLEIPGCDGYPLAATVVAPGAGTSDWVIVGPAIGVAARFYAPFAAALARCGIAAVTFDYRGIGASRPARLRGFDASMGDWAALDMAGVTTWVHHSHQPRRLFLVGHSLGGILAGLMDCSGLVDAMITVASENVYWRYRSGLTRLNRLGLVLLNRPVTAVCGYAPWSRVSSAEDLPAAVARQMSAWIRSPGGILDDPTLPTERYATFGAPVLAYSIDDDPEGTRRSVDLMMSAYPNVERRHIHPADAGLDHLGHFGYFRPSARPLWTQAVTWLDEQQPRGSAARG